MLFAASFRNNMKEIHGTERSYEEMKEKRRLPFARGWNEEKDRGWSAVFESANGVDGKITEASR